MFICLKFSYLSYPNPKIIFIFQLTPLIATNSVSILFLPQATVTLVYTTSPHTNPSSQSPSCVTKLHLICTTPRFTLPLHTNPSTTPQGQLYIKVHNFLL